MKHIRKMIHLKELPYRCRLFVKQSCYLFVCGMHYYSKNIVSEINKNISMPELRNISGEILIITLDDIKKHLEDIQFATTIGNVAIKLNSITTGNVTIAGF